MPLRIFPPHQIPKLSKLLFILRQNGIKSVLRRLFFTAKYWDLYMHIYGLHKTVYPDYISRNGAKKPWKNTKMLSRRIRILGGKLFHLHKTLGRFLHVFVQRLNIWDRQDEKKDRQDEKCTYSSSAPERRSNTLIKNPIYKRKFKANLHWKITKRRIL